MHCFYTQLTASRVYALSLWYIWIQRYTLACRREIRLNGIHFHSTEGNERENKTRQKMLYTLKSFPHFGIFMRKLFTFSAFFYIFKKISCHLYAKWLSSFLFAFVKPIFLYTLESKCDSHTFCFVPFFRSTNHFATHFAEKREKNDLAHFLYLYSPKAQHSTAQHRIFHFNPELFTYFFHLDFVFPQLKSKQIFTTSWMFCHLQHTHMSNCW